MTNRWLVRRLVAIGAVVLGTTACGSSKPTPSAPTQVPTAVVVEPTPVPSPGTTPQEPGVGPATPSPPSPPSPPVTMAAVGDIGMCGYREVAETARLVGGAEIVALLGDIAYQEGTQRNFLECFDPWWGPHRRRSRPVPGNHEYGSPNPAAGPYFSYFGANAGSPGQGYYVYEAGDWMVFALNSVIPIGEGSAQLIWLRNQLATVRRTQCAMAYWHHARFSSGRNGDSSWMRTVWQTLDEAGVDLVLTGHDHTYERFAPQDVDGRARRDGIRQFVVGTGGAFLYEFPTVKPNSEVRGLVHGVLQLSLRPDAYDWEFVPIAGKSFRDSGSAQCF